MCIVFSQSCWPQGIILVDLAKLNDMSYFASFSYSLTAKDDHKTRVRPRVLGQGKDLEKKMLFS